MPRALIIEDNAAARADLRDRLAAHPDVVIVGEAASLDVARSRLASQDYDLVFLDVQLTGGNAFDLVPLVNHAARIIFVTAYDEYAVRAFEVNALDYLLKPVNPQRLAASLARMTAAPVEDTPPPFPTNLKTEDVVYLRNSSRSEVVSLTDITAILAAQNYTDVWLADGRHMLVRRTLTAWEHSLGTTLFTRVARDAIVNISQVIRHERTGERGAQLYVRGRAQPIVSSQRHWPTVRARLKRIHEAGT